jgi:hypothetical protein
MKYSVFVCCNGCSVKSAESFDAEWQARDYAQMLVDNFPPCIVIDCYYSQKEVFKLFGSLINLKIMKD